MWFALCFMGLDSCIVVDESHFESLKVMSTLIMLKLNLLFLHRWVYLCFAQKFSATSYPAKLTTTIPLPLLLKLGPLVKCWALLATRGRGGERLPHAPLFLLCHCHFVTITFVGRGRRRGVARLGIPWHHCHWNSNSLKPPKFKEHWEAYEFKVILR